MAILIECTCHKKQSVKNKACSDCATDLDKLKRTPKARYWINYRVDGKQRTEYVGNSKREAEDAMGKRRGQIRENRIFDILPESRMTFRELADWYLDLSSTKGLRSFDRIKIALNSVAAYFGDRTLESLRPSDVEDFLATRLADGLKPGTVNLLFTMAKMAINKGFTNDLVGPKALKAFKSVKAPLKAGSNARTRIVGLDEYLKLMDVAPHYLKIALVLALHCGMRRGEICGLKWSNVDFKTGFIRLTADQTKEGKPKSIPMPPAVRKILKDTPPTLHQNHVVLHMGKPVFVGTFTYALKTSCKKASIPYGMKNEDGLRLHDLRAFWKSGATKAGLDPAIRSKILGHALTGMDAYYLRFTDDDLRAAMDRYTAWLEGELQKAYQSAYQVQAISS